MFRLMLTSIRSRIGNFVGALVAVTIAIALIAATATLIYVADTAALEADRFAGTSVVVQSVPNRELNTEADGTSGYILYQQPPRLPAALAEEIATLPGVEAAIPDIQFYAQILHANGEPLFGQDGSESFGMPWTSAALTPFSLQAGSAPFASDEIVIDTHLAGQGGFDVGDSVTVLTREMPETYRVSGIAAPPDGDGLPLQASIFFEEETAKYLAHSGELADMIAVVAAPGVDPNALAGDIDAHLDDRSLRTLTGRDLALADPTSDAEVFQDIVALLGFMASFSGFVAIFVMASTFTFSIVQRQREIGLQRAIGATPKQVRRMVGGEALLLAIIGTVIGLPLGLVIGDVLARILIWLDIAPDGFRAEPAFIPLAISAGCGIVITQVATFGAARRASKIRPIEALREASAPRRLVGCVRLIIGLLLLAGGIASVVLVPSLQADAQIALSIGIAMLLLTAAALLGPLFAIPFSWIVGRFLGKVLDAPGELAWWNARGAPARISSVASPLILAVGIACVMFFLTATIQNTTIEQSQDRTNADLIVLSGGAGVPLNLLAQIEALESVETASGVMRAMAPLDRHQGDMLELDEQLAAGVDPVTLEHALDLDVSSGSLADLQGNSMALSRLSAEMFKTEVGEIFDIHLDDGSIVEVEVVAIFNNFLGFEEMLFPQDLALRMTRAPAYDQVLVKLVDGADTNETSDAIASLDTDLSMVQVVPRDEFIATLEQAMVDGSWAVYSIVGVAVFFAGIAVINTMVMSTSERVREFALLRMVGATDRQVRTMVLGESWIVTMMGLTMGILIATLSMVSVSYALAGHPWGIAMPPLQTLGVVLVAAFLSMVAHMLPARLALRSTATASLSLKDL